MKKIDINKVPVTTFILFLICVIVTAALAGTNFITKARISALEEQSQNEALAEVFKDADEYVLLSELPTNSADKVCYLAKKGGVINGFVATAAVKGYGGDIKVMVGVDNNNTITGVKILSAADETPGLGMKITGKSYYEQYSGKSSDFENKDVTLITGATISSTAARDAVREALEVIKNAKLKYGEVK